MSAQHGRSGLGVVDEDDIGVSVATNQSQLRSVKRPVEVDDVLGLEICDLLAGRAVEGLLPEIVGVAVTEGIGDGPAVGSEADRPATRALEVESLHRLFGISRDNR